MVFEFVMLQESENLKEAGGYLAGECYVRLLTSENEDDKALLEKLLMEIVYMPSSFVSSGCAQLNYLRYVFACSIENSVEDQITKYVLHAAETLNQVNPEQTVKTSLLKFLEQKITVASQSQLTEVGELVMALALILAALDRHYQEYRLEL